MQILKSKTSIFFLVCLHLYCNNALCLVPLEGIILGKVNEDIQNKPFNGALNFVYAKGDDIEKGKLSYYFAFFKQGENLKRVCLTDPKLNYESVWKLSNAKRSVVSNLQYIGIDLTLKSIVSYAKKLEYTSIQFETLVNNLVNGSCSPNITVYSKKLIKDNFKSEWSQNTDNHLPSISKSPYFESHIKSIGETKDVLRKEFAYSLKNFRAFCSWNGDVEDYRLLNPYLKNPYIMAFNLNEMRRKKLELNNKTKELVTVENEHAVQVVCENLICRRRNKQEFLNLFPRMLGSSQLNDDLTALYCDHFQFVRTSTHSQPEQIKKWLLERSPEGGKLEALNFISLMTRIPSFNFFVDSYGQIPMLLEKNINQRWDKWMTKKLNTFNNNQLYEEPLELSLDTQVGTNEILKGQFNVRVNVGLSELDKVVSLVDKIDASFNLSFPANFLGQTKERINFFNKKGFPKKTKIYITRLIENIRYQLIEKEKFFTIHIWNEDFAEILAIEIIDQINRYRGNSINLLSKETINIPINFNFGVFALQYINRKFNFLNFQRNSLTFK